MSEDEIVKLMVSSLVRAREQALQNSGKVIESYDGKLVEKYADGTEILIRYIEKPAKVVKGSKIKLIKVDKNDC